MSEVKPFRPEDWTAALRSGEYQQGRCVLENITNSGSEFCCLGVLCDLAIKAGVEVEREVIAAEGITRAVYGGAALMPPTEVLAWSGYKNCPDISIGDHRTSLDSHNDEGRSFADIADAIDDHRGELFPRAIPS